MGGRIGESRVGMEPRLVDYELILGEDGKRSVGFGWFAGGMSILSVLQIIISSLCYVYFSISFI